MKFDCFRKAFVGVVICMVLNLFLWNSGFANDVANDSDQEISSSAEASDTSGEEASDTSDVDGFTDVGFFSAEDAEYGDPPPPPDGYSWQSYVEYEIRFEAETVEDADLAFDLGVDNADVGTVEAVVTEAVLIQLRQYGLEPEITGGVTHMVLTPDPDYLLALEAQTSEDSPGLTVTTDGDVSTKAVGTVKAGTDQDYTICDSCTRAYPSTSGYFYSSGAPSGSKITNVKVQLYLGKSGCSTIWPFWCGFRCGDYEIFIKSSTSGEYRIWNNYSSSNGENDGNFDDDTANDNDIYLYRNYNHFNGGTPNKGWRIRIVDQRGGGTWGTTDGTLRYIWFHISWKTQPDLYDRGESYRSFSPTKACPRDSFAIHTDIMNGGYDASGSFYVKFYASTNTSITTADHYLGYKLMGSIPARSWANCDWTGNLPSTLPKGTYNIGWIIDTSNSVTESNEGNNRAYKTGYKLSTRADLYDRGETYRSFSPTAICPGDSLAIHTDIVNGGATSSGNFYVKFYASTDTNITTADHYIGYKYMASVGAGLWANCDWTGNLPSSIPAGTYYVGWIIDANSGVTECKETNNKAYKTGYRLTVRARRKYCRDADGDGYGNPKVFTYACSTPAGYSIYCSDCNDANRLIRPGAAEACDNVDNDCDGATDESLSKICGSDVGVCQKGTQTCSAGNWGTCQGSIGSSTETCDNKDNDCDGSTDESVSRSCGSDVGECQSGNQACSAGSWGTCQGSIGSSAEICDNKDNDCDGSTDETLVKQCGTTAVGECEFGNVTCSVGVWGPCTGAVFPTGEACDNKDNDCDGSTDESLTKRCGTTDVGECEYGTETCSAGDWGSCQGSVEPLDESCPPDNKDNDCDGETDEVPCGDCTPGATQNCLTGNLGLCAAGTRTCADIVGVGTWGDCVQLNQPVTEVCDDQLDNDCDGKVDAADPDCVPCESSSIKPDNINAGANSTFILPIRVSSAPNEVASFGFDVTYDSSVLTYIGNSKGDLTVDFDFFDTGSTTAGIVTVGGLEAGLDKISAGANGVIVNLEFKVAAGVNEKCIDIAIANLVDDMGNWSSCPGKMCVVDCPPDGDVNGDGRITPKDALMAFQQYLGSANLNECQQRHAEVTGDGRITPGDALCIFQKYLGQPSCLD